MTRTRPDELRRFLELLTVEAPEGYEPYLIVLERGGKAPAPFRGSWKDPSNSVSKEKAIEWMEHGFNIGIAGTSDDALVNVDIDDEEETTPEDISETLRARSRSRGGWHGWFFGDPEDPIPNIPTDNAGEIRTDWQYVAAPGSYVPTDPEEVPEEHRDEHVGHYTIEHEAPVATLGYEDLPDVFKDVYESANEPAKDSPTGSNGDLPDPEEREYDADGDEHPVFDIEVRDIVGGKDPSARWHSPIHDSDTEKNSAITDQGLHTCWRHGVTHNGYQLLAALSGACSCREAGVAHKNSGAGRSRAEGFEVFQQVVEYAVSRGYLSEDEAYPLTTPTDDEDEEGGFSVEATYAPRNHVLLPRNSLTDGASSGWQWANTTDPLITRSEVFERVMDHIRQTRRFGDNALLDAMMSTGKTESTFRVMGEDGEPTTYFTSRTDLYGQAKEMAEEFVGGRVKVLPSADRFCPTFQGEHGEAAQKRVNDLRERKVRPKTMHEVMDLPCTHEEDKCPYEHQWGFDPDDYDVLIGHYGHAYLPFVTAGRHVVVDEYPEDSLTTELAGGALERTINSFCKREGAFPFTDYHDVIEHRKDRSSDEYKQALRWFDSYDWDPDEKGAIMSEDYHAYAPWMVYVLLTATPAGDAGSGYPFERCLVPDDHQHVGVFARGGEYSVKAIHLQTPPDFSYTRSVLALDGTPNETMWERQLGLHLNVREPLASAEEKRSYIRDTLGIQGVVVNDASKPYSSGEYVTSPQDATIVSEVSEAYSDPVVFSTKQAIRQYAEDWASDDGHTATMRDDEGEVSLRVPAKALDNFQNLRGSNRYKRERCAIIQGSPNYGDNWVRLQAAFEDQAVYPERTPDGRTYSGVEGIAEQMREAVVGQSALRVGRDGQGAVVVFNTACVPDWFPIVGDGRVVRTRSDAERDILDVLRDASERGEPVTAKSVAEDPRVNITYRGVLKALHRFAEHGYVSKDRADGRSYEWTPDGLRGVSPEGDMELPELSVEEVESELDHTVTYMPLFGVRGENLDSRGGHDMEVLDMVQDVRPATAEDGPPPG